MPAYYHDEMLFSEIYLEEITQEPETADLLATLRVITEYRDYADRSTLKGWKDSYVHEVLSALGFYAKPKNESLTELYPMGSGDEKPLSLCYVVLPDENLDKTIIGRNWAEKIIRALRENDLQWGILTNGRQWRIYHQDEPTPYETYLEIDLEAIIKDKAKDAYQIFHKFMKAENFVVNDEGKCQFDRFKQDSQDKIDYIEKELAKALKQREEGGQGVLSDLCMGYLQELRLRKDTNLDDEEQRKTIYHSAMLYMFRLLFLFYADARGLLSDDNHTLLEKIETECRARFESAGSGNEDFPIWGSLEEIFVDIDQTYNGGLFSPQESEFTQFLSDTQIADTYLVNVIYNLTTYQEKDKQVKPISYRDMSVRHLGTLYEGLLEHKLFIAQEDTEVKLSKGKIKFIPASQGGKLKVGSYIRAGEVYFAGDMSERKSSGSYFTPEDVVDYIVRNTVGEKLHEIKRTFLTEQQSTIRAIATALNDEERQKLSNLFEDKLMAFVREKVLNLSVLDPAMGSGHFLVNAANLISNFITEILNDVSILGSQESETDYWRRWVVENCIFGVDLNPLAVELAKLSLWILSMAKDQPLSFLKHHLKCGNSLVGADLVDIGNYPFSKYKIKAIQLSLFERDPNFQSVVEEAISKSKMIASHSSTMRYEVDEKKALLDEIERALSGYTAICDVHTRMFFNTDLIDEDPYYMLVEKRDFQLANGIRGINQYFHWQLEFPMILINNKGFDCIIGNPPYAAPHEDDYSYFNHHYKSTKSRNLYTFFIERLVELVSPNGVGGFVVPLSLTFSENMSEVRTLINNQEERSWKISSFDRIPDALFGGNVRTRCSILLGLPNRNRTTELSMTPMYRWFARERAQLFSSIHYVNIDLIKNFNNEWPKVGSTKQVETLKDLFTRRKCMGSLFTKEHTGNQLFYSSTAYNWLTVTHNMPPVYDLSGNLSKQTKYGTLNFERPELAWFALSIFCTTFSYWYWLVYGDGFDVTKKLLGSIPLSPTLFTSQTFTELVELGKDLQKEMEKHIVYKMNAGKKIGNYNLRFCRQVTDKIDESIFRGLNIPLDYLSDIKDFCNLMIKTELTIGDE